MIVMEAELSTLQRLGASEESLLSTKSNLASRYEEFGKFESAIITRQEAYSGFLRLKGVDHHYTLTAALCYASSLMDLHRYAEAKALMRKTTPVARRAFGDSHDLALTTRRNYARSLFRDPSATLDDLREAVETLEEIERTARRVFGGSHPTTNGIRRDLQRAREALRARESGAP